MINEILKQITPKVTSKVKQKQIITIMVWNIGKVN